MDSDDHPASPRSLIPPHSDNPPLDPQNSLRATGMDLDTASDAGTHEDSLTDSTYEIISAANTRSSDDEESRQDDTESLLSFEDSGPQDQVEVRRDDYVSPEASRAITPAPDYSEDEEEPPLSDRLNQSTTGMDYSELTDATVLQTPRASTNLDPSALEAGQSLTEASHTVDSPTAFFQDGVKLDKCRVSVQQTLAPSKLEVKDSFRVFWHGDTDRQDAVIEKIAQAISVSTDTNMDASITRESSTKFSIVQLSSFGQKGAPPQVALIPSGKTEVIVDTCQTCARNRKAIICGTRRLPHATSQDRPHSKPDLTVYYHSTNVGWSMEFEDARSITNCPYLDIRPTTASLDLEPFRPLDGKAVHMHVDGDTEALARKGSSPWKPMLVPIDMAHFQNLDPELLNRNLRCLHNSASDATSAWDLPPPLDELLASARRTMAELRIKTWIIRAMLLWTLVTMMRYMVNIAFNLGFTPVQPMDATQSMSTVTVTSTIRSTHISTSISTASPAVSNVSLVEPVKMTPIPSANSEVGSKLGEAHPNTRFRFELLRTEKGQLYLKLPHEMAKLRRPPPINVTAYTRYRPLEVMMSRWNASVYSLDFKNFDPSSEPLAVVVDSQKASGVYQVLRIDSSNPLHSIRALESGLMACLETTKDVAKTAQKELGLFRDQATGMILSSSDWLQGQMQNARQTSGDTASGLWERLAARREVIAKQADGARQEFMDNAGKQAESMTSALTQRITALVESRKDIAKSMEGINGVLKEHMNSGMRKVAEAEEAWKRTTGWTSGNPLTEARRRTGVLANKARELMAERREARRERRAVRKLAKEAMRTSRSAELDAELENMRVAASRRAQKKANAAVARGKAKATKARRGLGRAD